MKFELNSDLSNELTLAKSEKMNFKTFITSAIKYVCLMVLCVCFGLFLKSHIFLIATVPTQSMSPTIEVDDIVFGSRLAYKHSDVERGDIVVFKAPDDPSILYVKRVVGLPGDEISITNGFVFINGNIYTDDVFKEQALGDFGPYKVPENSYFMLGDNRNNSNDSRYWTNTFVTKNSILGKVTYRLSPDISKIK